MQDKRTLVIAPDVRCCTFVIRALVEEDGLPGVGRLAFDDVYWVPSSSAKVALMGWTPERIVIVDYPRWRGNHPGDIAAAWHMIKVAKARGAEVVWW